ncbi:iron-sulfur cluster assembly scaffold protein [Maricaulis sp. D1M11]|uniref:iron-sulfur cluster assembly scaffold protein n=1 Tax=Maricaulis sp. D1M11 TaxID=3076117 RepID=UPI0039B45ECD
MKHDLYSNDVLRLAAQMPRVGRLGAPATSSRKVSRLCGSEIEVDLMVQDGRVVDMAQRVKACALGQASAAILGKHVVGATQDELLNARNALRAMLKSSAPAPRGRFAELAVLASAKAYPARHQSIMLPFEAAVAAFEATATTTGLTTPLTR